MHYRIIGNNGFLIIQKNMNERGKQPELPDDDRIVFVPLENIEVIERVLSNWEQVRQGFYKMTSENVNC